jgi:hypothetical protein
MSAAEFEYHLLTRKEAMHKGHDVVEQVGSREVLAHKCAFSPNSILSVTGQVACAKYQFLLLKGHGHELD